MKGFFKERIRAAFLVFFALTFLAVPFFCSCDKETKSEIYYGYFDTVCVFSDYSGMSNGEFSAAEKAVGASLEKYHRLFDVHNEYEGLVNLATVNKMAGQGKVKVDKEIIDLLSFSKEMHELTEGKVNIAMGAPISLWKSLSKKGERIPTEDELNSLSKHTSIDSLVIDRENLTVELLDSEMSLDVGAIAKGFAAELIKSELIEADISGVVLDLGGNLCAVGTKPDGSGWSTGIKNPLYAEGAEQPYSRKVTLSAGALVTSGAYERYYTVGGVRYHHIIDPETLMPENRYLSVTVMAKDSGVADALSTAIFNMDYGKAQDFVSKLTDIEVTLIMNDGSVTVLPQGEK